MWPANTFTRLLQVDSTVERINFRAQDKQEAHDMDACKLHAYLYVRRGSGMVTRKCLMVLAKTCGVVPAGGNTAPAPAGHKIVSVRGALLRGSPACNAQR